MRQRAASWLSVFIGLIVVLVAIYFAFLQQG